MHTGLARAVIAPGGIVGTHLHSTEQSFYVLSGSPVLTLDGRSYAVAKDDCGLVPVGVAHAWSNPGAEQAVLLEANAPAPRLAGPPDTFWTGEHPDIADAAPPDIRDPRTRTFFRLGSTDMDVDALKLGASVDSPTVSASMATALLAYSGIAVKMLLDERLGAVLHTMFMVEYQPGGVAQPHDHPLEEAYYILEGEVDAVADGETFTLQAGDTFWTGVGCIHAFYNRSGGRVRWLETQSPQPPANHSYRFDRDWDHLRAKLPAGLIRGVRARSGRGPDGVRARSGRGPGEVRAGCERVSLPHAAPLDTKCAPGGHILYPSPLGGVAARGRRRSGASPLGGDPAPAARLPNKRATRTPKRHGPPRKAMSQATSRSFCASASDWSFFSDWFSICRIRSRVTLNVRPTSSSVRGCSPPRP